jgi:DNA invertase Pin-like site-specific DNA recombinase
MGDEMIVVCHYKRQPGRKRLNIDVSMVKRMKESGYTVPQIAKWFGCTKMTIWNRLKEEKNEQV